MTIEESNLVDFIGLDKDNGLVGLLISDHLQWDSQKNTLLKEKINAYLDYIESGQLEVALPESKGRGVYIELVHQVPPSPEGERVLNKIKEVVANSKVDFRWSQFVDE